MVPAGRPSPVSWRKLLIDVFVIQQSEAELFQVVGAGHAVGSFAHLLHGRHKQGDEDGDDGNHHQQFDQGVAAPSADCSGDQRHGHTSFPTNLPYSRIRLPSYFSQKLAFQILISPLPL